MPTILAYSADERARFLRESCPLEARRDLFLEAYPDGLGMDTLPPENLSWLLVEALSHGLLDPASVESRMSPATTTHG